MGFIGRLMPPNQRQGGGWALRLIGGGGEGPQAIALGEAIARLPPAGKPRWRWSPFLTRMRSPRAYGQASALVLAASKDTWGLVVNEAMAARACP